MADATAAGAVESRLLELIRAEGLVSGARLPVERELATQLGVSRSTVREAIRSLSSKGILNARQGSGTYVTDLSPELLAAPLALAVERSPSAITTLMDVRLMLETGAAELAAARVTRRDLTALRRLNDRVAAAPDPATMLDADRAFHHRIHELSGNELLVQLLESIWHLASGSRRRILSREALVERTITAHLRIIDSLEAHDPVAARLAMREHVDDIRVWLQGMIADDGAPTPDV